MWEGLFLGQEYHAIPLFFNIHIYPSAGCKRTGSGPVSNQALSTSSLNWLSDSKLTEAWSSFSEYFSFSKVDTPSKISISALWPPEWKIFLPCFFPYWSIVIRSHTGRSIYLVCFTPDSEYCTGSREARRVNAWGKWEIKEFLVLVKPVACQWLVHHKTRGVCM